MLLAVSGGRKYLLAGVLYLGAPKTSERPRQHVVYAGNAPPEL